MKKKTSKKFIIGAFILSIACVFLTLLEIYNSRKSYIQRYETNMEMYLEELVSSAEYLAKERNTQLTDEIIFAVEERFPTSSKNFCLIGKNDVILFLRDKARTAELFDITVGDYIGYANKEAIESARINSTVDRIQDNDRFLVTRVDFMRDTDLMTVAICTEETYLLESGNFDILLQHLMVYIGLLAVAFIVGVSYLSVRVKEKTEKEENLHGQLSENRVIIERLAKRLESRENGDILGGEGSYYPRSVVERVLSNLTREQRRKSRKIVVHCEKGNQIVLVRMAVLIERLLSGRGIFCLWAEDEYQIIVLNAENDTLENIAKQLMVQYKNMFYKDMEDIRITIDRL